MSLRNCNPFPSSLRLQPGLLAGAFTVLLLAATSTWAADDTFVQKAAMGGMAEVDAGTLASQKASAAAVKDFGQKMVQDHGKANDELKQIASSKSMSVPTSPDAKHQAAMKKLEAQSGAGFDAAFKKQMVADHQETIQLFEGESKSGKDPELKAFATKTLPTLRDHLKMAQALP